MSSYRGQWLPGDPRGFRDRKHRVHSSGDYRKPPPPEEHAALLERARRLAGPAVTLNAMQRERLGLAVLEKLGMMKISCAALAVDATHAHAVILANFTDAVHLFGRAKQFASHRLRDEVPGKLWGASSNVVRIRDADHLCATVAYIRRHARGGAWIWVWDEGLSRMGLSIGPASEE